MFDQIFSGKLRKHLIQEVDCKITPNKRFVSALNYEIELLKLNSLKHIKMYCFLFKINDFLDQFTSMGLLN